MKVPFAGQSTKDSDNSLTSARLLNCYREPAGDRIVLRSHLGTSSHSLIPSGASTTPPSAMQLYDGEIYFLHSDGLMHDSPAAASVAGVSSVTPVIITSGATNVPWVHDASMDTNNGNLTLTQDNVYQVYDGTTVSSPTGGAFTATSSCFTFNQLTVMTESDGRRVQWSDVADPTTIDPLNFATKEGRGDKIVRGLPVNNTIVIFGRKSTEYWYQTGAGDLTVRPGRIDDIGIHSYGAVAAGDDAMVFVGSDSIVYMTTGGDKVRISTTAVETSVSDAAAIQMAYYRDRGHKFFVLSFPYRASWIYDRATGEWSERGEGSDFGRWEASSAELLGSDYYIGVESGVAKLERNNVDVSGTMYRRAISETVQQGGDRFRIPKLEFQVNAGQHASEADLSLRVSKDAGENWSATKTRGMGASGETETRPTFRGLGQFRKFTAEVTWSGANDVIIDAEAIV
ncbi:MAG: hypothetical protein ACPG4X_20395 [Pikeienuella sp.]